MTTKMGKVYSLILILGSGLLVACGGGGAGSKAPVAQGPLVPELPVVTTAAHNVFLPEGVSFEKFNGEIDGAMLYAGTEVGSGAKSLSSTGGLSKALVSTRDVSGFVVETSAGNGMLTAVDVLDGIAATIGLRYPSFVSTGTQTVPGLSSAFSSFSLTITTHRQPTDLALELLGDVDAGALTTLPVASSVEPLATSFTVLIGVVYFGEGDVVVMLCVVPQDLAGTYSALTSTLTNGTIVSPTLSSQKTSGSDDYTVQAGSGKADFLFVVDNSGSMGDEQQAISDAASEFVNAITQSGLDYRVGAITTDNAALRDSNGDGGFTSDLVEYQRDVKPGTWGSGRETGIWFAERALQSMAHGDALDGSVTAEGYPRVDASMNIVIISDEPSQYTSRSGYVSFDPSNNLFVARNYTVHAIVEPTDALYSQYDDLAFATGGSTADIGDVTTFATIMNNIAKEAGGASSMYVLAQTPIASTIQVKVNGVLVANSASDGWVYNVANNSIVFYGTAIPAEADAVFVRYEYFN